MKKIAVFLMTLTAVSAVSLLTGYIVFSWTGPLGSPGTQNPEPPITVTATPQVKQGRFSAAAICSSINPSFCLNDGAGRMTLSGGIDFGGNWIDFNRTRVIYDVAAGYTDVFDPSAPGTPRNVTGVIPMAIIFSP